MHHQAKAAEALDAITRHVPLKATAAREMLRGQRRERGLETTGHVQVLPGGSSLVRQKACVDVRTRQHPTVASLEEDEALCHSTVEEPDEKGMEVETPAAGLEATGRAHGSDLTTSQRCFALRLSTKGGRDSDYSPVSQSVAIWAHFQNTFPHSLFSS